ncbi:hypothetical protein SUGI_0429800 [Cryptomeria japonica]|uniref:protein VACUOLELESS GAMETOPHYTES n=1 Tax=Cryptomeria japonica TaxID=3369 RepID=UPI00240897F5|nr:protein VACUOLELESS GAMETOPHYTES [Cryptomeria japonica]GLJ22807.1 hypothetical protein SUGI_0429800 [Cryptomeria japonica]
MANLQMVPKVGEEIQHSSHPQHPLSLVFAQSLYTCSGCREYGAGLRYRCNNCKFNMHEFCAKAPPTAIHPYHTQHQLVFHNKPAGLKKPKCGVCGKATNGSAFRCSICSFCIHPCCLQLPPELSVKEHPQHSLKLLSASPLPNNSPYTCNACNKKGTTWVYYCVPCEFYLHALCAKGVINGLQAQGISAPPKMSRVARAARYASQVVRIFVDGLVEGLGEDVGDGILDIVTREVVPPVPDGGAKRGSR